MAKVRTSQVGLEVVGDFARARTTQLGLEVVVDVSRARSSQVGVEVIYSPELVPTTGQITARARIEHPSNPTITALAAIQAQPFTSQLGTLDSFTPYVILGGSAAIANVTITARARIGLPTNTQTLTARARIEQTASDDITAKARISQAGSSDITAKARIELASSSDLTAKARILAQTSKTLTAKAKIVSGHECPNPLSFTSYWRLDETGSPVRVDQFGASNLIPNQPAQKVAMGSGFGARFLSSSASVITAINPYTFATNASIELSGDRTLAGFQSIQDLTDFQIALDKSDSGLEYLLFWDRTASKLKFQIQRDNGTTLNVPFNNLGNPGANTPFFFAIRVYEVAGVWSVDVRSNNDAVETTALGAGRTPATPVGSNLVVGAANVDLAKVTFLPRAATDAELDYLYNSGAGRLTLGSTVTDATIHWPFNEEIGLRANTQGASFTPVDLYPGTGTGKLGTGMHAVSWDTTGVPTGGLFAPSTAALTGGANTRTLAFWAALDDQFADYPIVWKGGPVHLDYRLVFNRSLGVYQFETENSSVVRSALTIADDGAEHLVVAGYDAALDQVYISVDNETIVTASGGGGGTGYNDTTAPFLLGAEGSPYMTGSNPDAFACASAIIDHGGISDLAWTQAMVASYWNAGAGEDPTDCEGPSPEPTQQTIQAKARILERHSSSRLRGRFEIVNSQKRTMRGYFSVSGRTRHVRQLQARARLTKEGTAHLTGFFVVATPRTQNPVKSFEFSTEGRTERTLMARARIIK